MHILHSIPFNTTTFRRDFKDKFDVKSINIPDQRGNYRETLRINDDLVNLLNWQPQDRLKEYIAKLNPTL